jgi:hypothetical protein
MPRQTKLGAGGGDPIDDYLVFRSELRAALREGTAAALRAVIRRWAGPRDPQLGALIAQPDKMLEPIIRRMILEEPQLADLHDAALPPPPRRPPRPPPPGRSAPGGRARGGAPRFRPAD